MNPAFVASRRALLAWWAAVTAASLAATLMIAAPVQASVPPAAYTAAFQQFQRAAGGDAGAIEGAAEQFGKLSADEPADPVLLAYSGAATTLRATITVLPWRRLSYADEGLGRAAGCSRSSRAARRRRPAHRRS